MDRLISIVEAFKAGPALLNTLRTVNLVDSILPGLIADVLEEGARAKNENPNARPPTSLTAKPSLCTVPQLSFVTPRGKHDLAFSADYFTLQSARLALTVPYTAITNVVILDSLPQDTKGRVLLFLVISPLAGLLNGKSPLTAVVISTTAAVCLKVDHPKGVGELEGPAAVVLCQILGQMGVAPSCFCSPDAAVFSSMSQGQSGVPAHVKAKSGTLFPLPAGICFLESPAIFIPRAEIKAMELARAGGTSSTFDVFVHRTDGRVEEFGMLPREETGPIELYMMKAGLGPPQEDSGGDESDADGADEASASSDDEDFDPSPESSHAEPEQEGQDPSNSGGGSQGESRSESEASSSEDASDVELVSEDDMSTAALQKLLDSEEPSGGRKRRRGGS